MKVNNYVYQRIKAGVQTVLEQNPGIEAKYIANGMSSERFRWDVFWAIRNVDERQATFIGGLIMDTELNDQHIDTALRQAMGELGQDWGSIK